CARHRRLTAPARTAGGGGLGEPASLHVDVSDTGVHVDRHMGRGTGDCLRARVPGKLIRRVQVAEVTAASTLLIDPQACVLTGGRTHDAGEGPVARLWRRDRLLHSRIIVDASDAIEPVLLRSCRPIRHYP